MKKSLAIHVLLLQPKRITLAIIALLSLQAVIAQSVGVGTASPNPSARLEVNSTTQGILIPTLTSAQRSAISNPATGLLVFQTDGAPGFYYYTGLRWLSLANGHQPNSAGVSSNYGLTTTVAGTGATGAINGIGTVATFDAPFGLATDAFGNILVTDFNYMIRKVVPLPDGSYVVSTVAGTGSRGYADDSVSRAIFSDPVGVGVDDPGNMYVADRGNSRIRKISTGGVVTTLAGNGSLGYADNNIGTEAAFNGLNGIAVDGSGNVYVADRFNYRIRKVSPTGAVTTFAGSGAHDDDDGTGTAASFNEPYGIALDAAGNLYVADMGNHKIRKISSSGEVTTLAGTGSPGNTDGATTIARFDRPAFIAVDAFGNVYVTGLINHNVRKITPAGIVSTLAGNQFSEDINGIGTAAFFAHPCGLAIDASGNLYVADRDNNKIRKIITQ
jgi:sugar lactone lactonase YvrE